jgi:hypothetical protein
LTRLDLDTIEAELITTHADRVDAGPFGTYTLFWRNGHAPRRIEEERMAKHRAPTAPSRPGKALACGMKRAVTPTVVGGFAIATAAAVGGVATTVPESISASQVDLSGTDSGRQAGG